MKAWKAQSRFDCEGLCEIVFADKPSEAKRRALRGDIFHDQEYVDMRATRAPEFDGREDSPPSMEELVRRHGWSVECHCGMAASASDNPEWHADRVVRCDHCRKKCENCRRPISDDQWCCEACFGRYDGERFYDIE